MLDGHAPHSDNIDTGSYPVKLIEPALLSDKLHYAALRDISTRFYSFRILAPRPRDERAYTAGVSTRRQRSPYDSTSSTPRQNQLTRVANFFSWRLLSGAFFNIRKFSMPQSLGLAVQCPIRPRDPGMTTAGFLTSQR